MKEILEEFVPSSFSDKSRVWVFQSSRPLQNREIMEIDEQLLQFYSQWSSHQIPVKGWAKVLWNHFIVVMADEESQTSVSGCSTDSMMRIVKSIERQYSLELFNRLSISFLIKDKVEMLPLSQVQYALDKGYISSDTLLFNNLVDTKYDLLHNWLIPLRESWLASRLNLLSLGGMN